MKFFNSTPKAIPIENMFALVFKNNNVNKNFSGKEDRLNLFKINDDFDDFCFFVSIDGKYYLLQNMQEIKFKEYLKLEDSSINTIINSGVDIDKNTRFAIRPLRVNCELQGGYYTIEKYYLDFNCQDFFSSIRIDDKEYNICYNLGLVPTKLMQKHERYIKDVLLGNVENNFYSKLKNSEI